MSTRTARAKAIYGWPRLERRYVAWAIAQTRGHRSKAARELGVDPKTLRKWLGQVDGDDGLE